MQILFNFSINLLQICVNCAKVLRFSCFTVIAIYSKCLQLYSMRHLWFCFLTFLQIYEINSHLCDLFKDVVNILDKDLQINLRMSFHFVWNDSRILKLNNSVEDIWESVNVQTAINNLFFPDIYIYKLISQSTNKVFNKNIESILLGPNSTIR